LGYYYVVDCCGLFIAIIYGIWRNSVGWGIVWEGFRVMFGKGVVGGFLSGDIHKGCLVGM
jgi:hypothetical protein